VSVQAGKSSYNSPTTVVSQQLSGLQLLLQQHRQQSPQQLVQPHRQQPLPLPPPPQQQQQVAPAREVYIMRGLPGSGKSTRAAQIAAEARAAAGASSNSSVEPVAVHSTDSYFIDPVSGVYVFNAEMLSVNHQKNLDAFCASLAAGVGTVIVDNTNIQVGYAGRSTVAALAASNSILLRLFCTARLCRMVLCNYALLPGLQTSCQDQQHRAVSGFRACCAAPVQSTCILAADTGSTSC
jgi:hypothetical protein